MCYKIIYHSIKPSLNKIGVYLMFFNHMWDLCIFKTCQYSWCISSHLTEIPENTEVFSDKILEFKNLGHILDLLMVKCCVDLRQTVVSIQVLVGSVYFLFVLVSPCI